jgi:hypothetical protein
MENDECDAAIIHRDSWAATRMFGRTMYCKSGRSPMVALKQVVYTEANTMPVRGEILEAMSWTIAKEVELGTYVGFADTARTNYTFGLLR